MIRRNLRFKEIFGKFQIYQENLAKIEEILNIHILTGAIELSKMSLQNFLKEFLLSEDNLNMGLGNFPYFKNLL